ncbi:MAG: FAD-dependent oxidoreductase [Bacteroidales bacterium]|nr:FAD-dependent oxidoreductase [Bacteroidales bacterium]
MLNIAIIGAGPAGIEAASILAGKHHITLFEKSEKTLSNIHDKALLFPDFSSAEDLAARLDAKLKNPNIELRLNTPIVKLEKKDNGWLLTDDKQQEYNFPYVLLATGYRVFDAHQKEELGYGIYKGVITSLELEKMIKEEHIVNVNGDKPKQITFLQCVGSRDEKSGNHYCSKVCCVTAVKQAIEIKKMLPDTDVYVFYMDLRMWGQGFEEMYRTAQEEYGVNFVRGRISEAASTYDNRVQIKAEDTLMGLPLNLNTDLLVLMVGMCASDGTKQLSQSAGIDGLYGFAQSKSEHLEDNMTAQEGLFVAGACKRPSSVNDTIQDARAAAVNMMNFIQE